MTYGGLGFDANSEAFTLREVQRSYSEKRIWPFVAPKELRMFNRVNIRSDAEKFVFLSNLHPGFTGTAASASNSTRMLAIYVGGNNRCSVSSASAMARSCSRV